MLSEWSSCLRFLIAAALLLPDGCLGIQKFEETPGYTEVNPGQDAKLSCRVRDKRGQCIWQKDNKLIGMLMKKYEWAAAPDAGDCSLWVRSADLTFDDGLWQCQVTLSDFAAQDALTSDPARLVVRVSPKRPDIEYGQITILPGSNVTARAGEVAHLSCASRYGNPPALLRWYLGETEIRPLRPQVNSTEKENPRTWMARSVVDVLAERSRYGEPIRCVAQHAAYANPSSTLATEVRFDVRYAPETRLVGAPGGGVHLEEDRDRLAVRCVANANPPASILWKRSTGLGGATEVVSRDETLILSPIQRSHAGRYFCEAANSVGESSPLSLQISINYPPKITSVGPERLTTALLYTGASFECYADAMPPPEYRWLQVFPDGREPQVRGQGQRFFLNNVTYDQQGQYICLALNVINGNTREARSDPVSLQVVGAPRVVRPARSETSIVSATEGGPARLEIRLCSDPRPRLVAWEWGRIRLHAGEVLESRYRALDLEPLAFAEDCYAAILELTSTAKEDQRLYNVTVENDRGSDRRTLMLRVNEPGQIPLVIGAVAGFTVLSILIMGFVCFLRTEHCCFARNTVPALQQVHCSGKPQQSECAREVEDTRLGIETMERTTQRYAHQKQLQAHTLKPVSSLHYQQCYDHEPQPQPHPQPQPLQPQRHQRHHHRQHHVKQPLHGPQCELQTRHPDTSTNDSTTSLW
ncbi:kin of IRRE-like protein 2 isoform X1 [Neodiprion fabricii]|uniref:kin of IRRE-like protein 2 isoform X1 n=1 Tax=Neodiprion fabricii TaxID=2872261 RepID=UPI001ED91AC4|nr:kin of IRRE-like protein 2 isoform X1 [Neodiprion fabricii]